MKLFISLNAPYRWAVVDRKGAVVESGGAEELEAVRRPKRVDEIIGVAPAESVVMRAANVPSKRRSNVESAIPYALEESLSEEVENLHFALLAWTPGQPATVAVVAKSLLSEWLARFSAAGLRLDAIVPEFVILPLHGEPGITVARTDANRICVRQGEFYGVLLDDYSFQIWWQQLEEKQGAIAVNDPELAKWMITNGGDSVSQWGLGDEFVSWLKERAPDDVGALSILIGEYLPPHRRRGKTGLKVAAMVSFIAFSVLLAANYYEYRQLRGEYRELKRDIVSLFMKTFPGEKFIGRPQDQVQSLLADIGDGAGGGGDFVDYMEAVKNVFPRNQARVDELTYRDREILVSCTVNDFSTLDVVKQELDKLPNIDAVLVSSGSREKQVSGRFKLSQGS